MKRGRETQGTGHAASPAAASLSPDTRTQTPAHRGGRLFVVATPIGNLADCSPRAREVLGEVRVVLAEDTRRVRKLLTHFAIRSTVRSLHEHNEAREVPRLLAELAAGSDLALVSDAGTPLLADPGYRLVRACREHGVPVLTVPGPSAATAAVAVSGLPPVPFTFGGFLPAESGGPSRRAGSAGLAAAHAGALPVAPPAVRRTWGVRQPPRPGARGGAPRRAHQGA